MSKEFWGEMESGARRALTLGSLFDGIGGWQLAAVRAGIVPIWSSEIEAFPLEVTKRHFPDTTQLGDVTKIDGGNIPPVDIICAGSPCQDLSIAGKRAGLAGERSGLFVQAINIVRQMRRATGGKQPRFFVWENVPGAFSSNHRQDFRTVLAEIGEAEIPMPKSGRWADAGMVRTAACDIAWRVLDAQYWGVPQRRKRIFLVADFAETGRRSGEILFEPEGVQGDTPQGEGTRKGTAAGTQSGAGSASAPIVLKIRQPRNPKLGGAGAMWQEDKAYTVATHQDHTLIEPSLYDAQRHDEYHLRDVAHTLDVGCGSRHHENIIKD